MAAPPLLVLGASAGGGEALLVLVAGLPTDLPAAVLVTVHTGDRPHSTLPRVLDRAGPLPAAHAADREPLRGGRVPAGRPDPRRPAGPAPARGPGRGGPQHGTQGEPASSRGRRDVRLGR